MPEAPPPGILPIYLTGKTLDKFGFKNGEGSSDLVPYKKLSKEEVVKEIQVMGVMSDFTVAKKIIIDFPGDTLFFEIDRESKYGEVCLLYHQAELVEGFMRNLAEQEEALAEQIRAELQAEEDRKADEYARLNVVYEDKPITPRPWVSATSTETDNEIKGFTPQHATRELISIEVSRPKRLTKQAYKFSDRNAELVAKFQPQKDPNFKIVRENDLGIQVAPVCSDSNAQTTWYRSVNKSIQYESASINTDALESDKLEGLLIFLERATTKIELALQQNESVDIFHETFRLGVDDDNHEGTQGENELRELKNFADPAYSKFKALSCIDWMPKAQGMVAVSAVRNISFDQRIPIFGQTHTSYILLWDFRLLVKPLILMRANHEIFTFRFNKTNPNYVVGGLITGQVVLWDITDAMAIATRKSNRGMANNNNACNTNAAAGTAPAAAGLKEQQDADEDVAQTPVAPKFVSSIDHSHKKCVADLFWLSPKTQINYRGQLVGEEHLDEHSHQFVTVAGDGSIMVWDTRYEAIANDELRHIGRAKHVPTEKSSSKENGGVKPVWGPIFKAHLKRLEGVGELSLCRVCETADTRDVSPHNIVSSKFTASGDHRSQFTIATEEGDVIFADLSARRTDASNKNTGDDEEDAEETEFSCVKWLSADHPRPSVCLMESPFFPQILLSVSDWGFHIWKCGQNKPLFVSPISNTYLTAGSWSLTRPAVLFIACADGQILAWDFTDTSFKASIELKATHSRITSMEFLNSNLSHYYSPATGTGGAGAAVGGAGCVSNVEAANLNAANNGSNRYNNQLLAVGDEVGTLHIFEVPRNLTRPVHKEESIMLKFLEREIEREVAAQNSDPIDDQQSDDVVLNAAMHNMNLNSNSNNSHGQQHNDAAAATATGGGGHGGTSRANTAHGTERDRVGTTGGVGGMGDTSAGLDSSLSAEEESERLERERNQKEEDEFLKMESGFISELQLVELPSFVVNK